MGILEKKLEGRGCSSSDSLASPIGGRRSAHRNSSTFNILPKESDEGVMIEPSMVASSHMARKASFVLKTNKSAKQLGSMSSVASGSAQASASGEGGGANKSVSQPGGFPAGAQIPAAFYKDIEEQLADALFKRCQAKLMADPDQANVESALADGLKVQLFKQ